VAEAARRHGDSIAPEVLALDWKIDDAHGTTVGADGFTEISVDGTPVGVHIEVIPS